MDSFSHKLVSSCIGLNILLIVILAATARTTDSFYMRLVVESAAACGLILVTLFAWLQRSSLLEKLLTAVIGAIVLFASAGIALRDQFAAWFEVASMYMPAASIVSAILLLAGYRIVCGNGRQTRYTFSVRSILVATTLIAMAIVGVGTLTKLRAAGDLDSILWLADALILVVPATLLCFGASLAILSDRPLRDCHRTDSTSNRLCDWADLRLG